LMRADACRAGRSHGWVEHLAGAVRARGSPRTNRSVIVVTCTLVYSRAMRAGAAHNGASTSTLPPQKRTTDMGFIGLIISWLIIGAIIGLLARAVMPGKQAMGLGMTIVLGIVGAIVGGFIGGLLGGDG